MKILLFSFIACLAFLLQPVKSNAQIRLFVDSIDGIPNPAVEDSSYFLSFHVERTDSDVTTFSGDLFILIRSESVGVTDTMGIFQQITLFPNGDTTLIDTFTFESSSFDGGDNIVVVWPASSSFIIPDTLHTHVNFSAVSVSENGPRASFNVYPNPARDFIRFVYHDAEKIEQVRVLDILGREFGVFDQAVTTLNTRTMASGLYFIEVRQKNGIRTILRFVVE